MKRNKRQIVSLLIICFSFLISLIVYVTSSEQILTGYRVVNGVKSITYMPKLNGVLAMSGIPIIMSILWDFIAKKNEGKIAEKPELLSYKIRGAFINFYFLALSVLPAIMGIINIILWIKSTH